MGLEALWHVGHLTPTRDGTRSSALEGRFLTTGAPGRSLKDVFSSLIFQLFQMILVQSGEERFNELTNRCENSWNINIHRHLIGFYFYGKKSQKLLPIFCNWQ